MIFAMVDGLHSHLFAYHPQYLPLTRLTNGAWDDIDPSVSPDGSKIAYASRQNGYWDIYVLDLISNQTIRITDTPEYDGVPTWSPDAQFLAYESYTDLGTQIFIRTVADLSQAPVQMTFEPGESFSPAWSPQGREIVFVSTRSGQEEIWLSRLDRIDDRFINISQSSTIGRDRAPRWSPEGSILIWATDAPGTSVLMSWDSRTPERPPRQISNGNTPVWSPDGNTLLVEVREANQTALAVYRLSDGGFEYPPSRMPGHLRGIDWHAGPVADAITKFAVPPDAREAAAALYQPRITIQTGLQSNRFGLVALKDVAAPYPYLHDAVDESFIALRQQIGRETGWDFLGALEQAYLPITIPLGPGMQESWLYTGRAFAVNPVPMTAGWLVVMREEIGGQTYWRMYVRCLYQDASQGQPITQRPWDLSARYRGDPRIYDHGGEYTAIPEGYWVDFTELAARYGWERLPAQINWRTYYPATLFGTFVLRGNYTWQASLDQLYPPEALATPTQWITLTSTITPTPTMYYQRFITPSVTPTVTPTATRRPTLTPVAVP
jgi:TolB protein